VKGGGKEFTIESPLIVYNQDNSYHHDMEMIFQGLILPKKPLT
jgi:tRNA1(Val) A37 N6-methylase TrmN6